MSWQAPDAIEQQADAAVALSPPWLSNDSPPLNGGPMGIGGRFMYNLGLASDALLEKLNQGMRARMPRVCDVSALPTLGNDRVMTQGPGETTAAFRVRLQRAFELWQYAGTARGILDIVASYINGQLPSLATQVPITLTVGGYKAKNWAWLYNTSDPSGTTVRYQSTVVNWSWDGQESVEWWRTWLVLFAYLSAPVASGSSAATASKSGGFVTITGLAGVSLTATSPTLPAYLTLSGAASGGNNGTFQVTQVISATSVVVANPAGVSVDANDGSIAWSLAYYPGYQPAPVWGFPGQVWGGNSNQAIGVQLPGAPGSANCSGFFAQLRALLRLWKSAQTFYPWILLSFAGDAQVPWGGGGPPPTSEFTPWNPTIGHGNPDGTWAHWGKPVAGGYVPSRVTGVQAGALDCVIDGTGSYLPQSYVQVT